MKIYKHWKNLGNNKINERKFPKITTVLEMGNKSVEHSAITKTSWGFPVIQKPPTIQYRWHQKNTAIPLYSLLIRIKYFF